VHRELAGDDKLVARFRREGTLLRKLLSPHAVTTYELGETAEGLPFIAMELLEGDTLLAAFRNAGRLPWQRVFEIGKGVCSALTEAHGLGIVHRDLKPANIFLGPNDFVKVLDFGIAKILSSSEVSDPRELTIMGTAVGTLEYMAPEQLMGGRADLRTDIYTLGVVLYETICGRRPFNAAGLELLTEQLSEAPPPASAHLDVPPEVDRVLQRCLAEDLDERFASALDLSRALDEALAVAAPRPAAASAEPRAVVPAPVAASLPVPPPVVTAMPPEPPLYEPPPEVIGTRLGPRIIAILVVAAIAAAAAVRVLS
jgi:serine/threonine-protein kinase